MMRKAFQFKLTAIDAIARLDPANSWSATYRVARATPHSINASP
jgi:hypothetical protein